MVILIVLIMIISIIMILSVMTNTEKLKLLEHYLKSLMEIITSQQEPMMVLQEEEIIT